MSGGKVFKVFSEVTQRSKTASKLFQAITQTEPQAVQAARARAALIYQRNFPTGHVAPEHSFENIQRVMTNNVWKRYPPLKIEPDLGYSFHHQTNTLHLDKYDPEPHKVVHELRHAYDHHTGHFDFADPVQRSASEYFSYATQKRVAKELGLVDDNALSPMEQALIHGQKQAKGYGGTPKEITAHVDRVKKFDDL